MAAVDVSSLPSTADARVFTISAATLKFETRADILPYLKPLIDTPDVEEVHLSGNTYGVEACKFLSEILATKKNLRVCPRPSPAVDNVCRVGCSVCGYLFHSASHGDSPVPLLHSHSHIESSQAAHDRPFR